MIRSLLFGGVAFFSHLPVIFFARHNFANKLIAIFILIYLNLTMKNQSFLQSKCQRGKCYFISIFFITNNKGRKKLISLTLVFFAE
jgi:hypothetical protein